MQYRNLQRKFKMKCQDRFLKLMSEFHFEYNAKRFFLRKVAENSVEKQDQQYVPANVSVDVLIKLNICKCQPIGQF